MSTQISVYPGELINLKMTVFDELNRSMGATVRLEDNVGYLTGLAIVCVVKVSLCILVQKPRQIFASCTDLPG